MEISDEDVRQARRILAEIVTTHDAKYASLFEILNDEVERREALSLAIDKAIAQTDLQKTRSARLARRRKRSKK